MKHKTFYRRNLPHLQPKNGVFAVTTRLKGSLPKGVIEQLRDQRDWLIAEAKAEGKTNEELETIVRYADKLYFGQFDDLLDNTTTGPHCLAQPEIAAIVQASLHFIDGRACKIAAYCIMSNHVHIVLYNCQKQLFKIMASFKRFTGTRANDILYGQHQKGDQRPSFWQEESYDHLIQSRKEFYNQVRYVINNPVKAKFVEHWKDWKWSYLSDQYQYLGKRNTVI